MIAKTRRFSPGIVLCAGLTLSLASLAQAQPIFQSTFPGGGTGDAARGGVLLTSDGGTISVGESSTFSKTYDVYVVKTDECGSLQWSTTYDFGGSDFGRKIRATEDGGYIIVGTTNRSTCCDDADVATKADGDIFLLKIDQKGGVEWAKTYGGTRTDEGTDVQLYFGEGYVVTGNTQSFGDGKINGYLMRTDLSGNNIWGRSYGVRDGVEQLNSCTVTAKGDILAVGSTSHSFTKQEYILAIRTDGDGFIRSGWPNIYPYQQASAARHIIGTSDGTFVIAGWIVTDQTNTRDAYMLRINDDGTPIIDWVYAEAYFKSNDEIAEVRETFDGELIFTGYTDNAPGGLGGRDLLLGETGYKLDPHWFSVHGAKREDEGFSLAFDAERSKKYGQIYVAANGVTTSFTRAGDEDLYLIQALQGGKTGCFDGTPEMKDFMNDPFNKTVEYCHPLVRVQCSAKVEAVYHKNQRRLCTSCKLPKLPEEESLDLGESLAPNTQPNGFGSEDTQVSMVQVKGRTETVQNSR